VNWPSPTYTVQQTVSGGSNTAAPPAKELGDMTKGAGDLDALLARLDEGADCEYGRVHSETYEKAAAAIRALRAERDAEEHERKFYASECSKRQRELDAARADLAFQTERAECAEKAFRDEWRELDAVRAERDALRNLQCRHAPDDETDERLQRDLDAARENVTHISSLWTEACAAEAEVRAQLHDATQAAMGFRLESDAARALARELADILDRVANRIDRREQKAARAALARAREMGLL
jgi:hypothetical protein